MTRRTPRKGRLRPGKLLLNSLQFLVLSMSHEAILKRPNESCLLRKTHDVWEGTSSDQWPSITQNLSSPPPSSASVDKSPSSTLPYNAQRRGHIYGITSTTNAPSAYMEEDQSCERLDGRE